LHTRKTLVKNRNMNFSYNRRGPKEPSPEIDSIKRFQYVKPNPTSNDMNSMCSFSPRDTLNADRKNNMRDRIGTGSYLKHKRLLHDKTGMRFSENTTLRSRNQHYGRKKLSLKNRSSINDRSKELNSIDEKTPTSMGKLGRPPLTLDKIMEN
jgi:hypothetical protein